MLYFPKGPVVGTNLRPLLSGRRLFVAYTTLKMESNGVHRGGQPKITLFLYQSEITLAQFLFQDNKPSIYLTWRHFLAELFQSFQDLCMI